MITTPEKKAEVIDEMDAGMDLLRTTWLALMNTDWIEANGISAAAATLHQAMARLDPVREAVNKAHGRGQI